MQGAAFFVFSHFRTIFMTHRSTTYNTLFTALLFLVSLAAANAGQAPSTVEGELPRFKELATSVANSAPTERPDPKLSEALDILLRAARRAWEASPNISDTQLEKQLSAFAKAANPKKKDFSSSEPCWFSFHTARQRKRFAIAFTYGPISRLAVFNADTKQPMPVDRKMAWLYPWSQKPVFLSDGSLLVLSHSVQDMGIRTGRRVDTLRQQDGQWKHIQSLTRQSSLDLSPGVKVAGQTLTLQSLDEFQTFFVASAVPVPLREESFQITQGKLRPLNTILQDQTLRCADAWMAQARAARRPTADQKKVRQHLPDREMLSEYHEKRLAHGQVLLSLEFDDITLRFTLQRASNTWQVRALKAVTGK